MEAPRGLGRCRAAFWLALLFDAGGFAALLAGVFADVFFADLLIYGGGVGVFFSLLWWVFWYVGNLEVPPAELQDDVVGGKAGRGLAGLVRSLSARFSGPFARTRGRPPKPPAAGGRGAKQGRDDGRAAAAAAATTTTPEEEQEQEGDLVEGFSNNSSDL